MPRVAFDVSTREAQAVAVSQRIRESLLLGRSASEPLQIVPFHQWFQSLRVYDFNSLVAAKEMLGSLITLVSSLLSSSLSAQKSRVYLMSLLQV
jgi:hypothetical protein